MQPVAAHTQSQAYYENSGHDVISRLSRVIRAATDYSELDVAVVSQRVFLSTRTASCFYYSGNMVVFRACRPLHMTTTIIVLSVSSIICLVLLYHPSIVQLRQTVAVAGRKSDASTSALDVVGNSKTAHMTSGGERPFQNMGLS
jgi:hypothetical protein